MDIPRVPLNPDMADAVHAALLPTRRTPLGVLTLVQSTDITDETKIFEMGKSGLAWKYVAILMGGSEEELKSKFEAYYDRGRADMLYRVANNLIRAGDGTHMRPDREAVTAAVFILKAQADWAESAPGSKGVAVSPGSQLDPSDVDGRRKRMGQFIKFAAAFTIGSSRGSVGVGSKPRPPDGRLPIRS